MYAFIHTLAYETHGGFSQSKSAKNIEGDLQRDGCANGRPRAPGD
jgi:hypothetical protein